MSAFVVDRDTVTTLVAAHWVRPGAARTDRARVTQYLLDKRYPGAEVLS